MPDSTPLPFCPKCGGPTWARHAGSGDGVRAAWAECRNVRCGERIAISFDMWLEHFRPRDPAAAEARALTIECV